MVRRAYGRLILDSEPPEVDATDHSGWLVVFTHHENFRRTCLFMLRFTVIPIVDIMLLLYVIK